MTILPLLLLCSSTIRVRRDTELPLYVCGPCVDIEVQYIRAGSLDEWLASRSPNPILNLKFPIQRSEQSAIYNRIPLWPYLTILTTLAPKLALVTKALMVAPAVNPQRTMKAFKTPKKSSLWNPK